MVDTTFGQDQVGVQKNCTTAQACCDFFLQGGVVRVFGTAPEATSAAAESSRPLEAGPGQPTSAPNCSALSSSISQSDSA